jgi:hypothetical protein
VQKVLETANIKLASVVTDVLGVSARAMLMALIAGDHTPEALAALAQRRMRRKRAALGEALTGRVTAHHRFLPTSSSGDSVTGSAGAQRRFPRRHRVDPEARSVRGVASLSLLTGAGNHDVARQRRGRQRGQATPIAR